MTVKAILSAKRGDLISIEPTATVDTAIQTLAKHKIGALLIFGPDRRVVGILSERDIVRVLAEQGPEVLGKPLAQVMTRKRRTQRHFRSRSAAGDSPALPHQSLRPSSNHRPSGLGTH